MKLKCLINTNYIKQCNKQKYLLINFISLFDVFLKILFIRKIIFIVIIGKHILCFNTQ